MPTSSMPSSKMVLLNWVHHSGLPYVTPTIFFQQNYKALREMLRHPQISCVRDNVSCFMFPTTSRIIRYMVRANSDSKVDHASRTRGYTIVEAIVVFRFKGIDSRVKEVRCRRRALVILVVCVGVFPFCHLEAAWRYLCTYYVQSTNYVCICALALNNLFWSRTPLLGRRDTSVM